MRIPCNAQLAAASRRDVLKYAGLATVSVGLAACGTPQAQGEGVAEIIFRGGPILTMNDASPRAEGLAIGGGRILAVGAIADVDARRGRGTRVVDLGGRALLPGLIDPHIHANFSIFEDWDDVSPVTTPTYDAVLAKLREAVRRTPPGDWVRAQLFDPSITQGAHSPTVAELDALAPDHPLLVFEGNGHVAYLNSRALQLAGVTRDTPDPPAGRYGRAPDGSLTGRVDEPPALLPIMQTMPVLTAAELQARMLRQFDRAAAVGCTAVHDCGIGSLARADDLALVQSVMQTNPPIRFRGMLFASEMDAWERMGLRPGFGDDRLRIDGVKVVSDGSNQAQTGYQRANYLGSDKRGVLNYTLEQMTDSIRRAHRGGWQVGVHANGDAAIDTTLQAYETVLRETPRADHRHRIEHCSVLRPEHIAKMRALGLSPSFTIGHVRWWGKAFRDRILGPERARFYDPCASALRAGLRISLHSDWSVTPLEPLRYVEDAVTRIMHEGGGVFFPEERIPVEAALKAVTLDAAWQCRMDDITGSLEQGKYADLVLLEQDPTAVDATRIKAIGVSETWLAGERRHTG